MSSNSFLVLSLGFSTHSIISSTNDDSFTSFPICILFISFSSLIAMARTFTCWIICSTMSNNSGESGHPCLVLDLSGNVFNFSPLRMMLAVGFSYMFFYYVEVDSLYPSSLESFYWKQVLNLSKAFSASIEMIMWFLFFGLLIWYITLIDLQILKNPYIPGINPTWSWCVILLIYIWIQLAGIFLRIFASMFISVLVCNFVFCGIKICNFVFCGQRSRFGIRVMVA